VLLMHGRLGLSTILYTILRGTRVLTLLDGMRVVTGSSSPQGEVPASRILAHRTPLLPRVTGQGIRWTPLLSRLGGLADHAKEIVLHLSKDLM